MFCAWNDAIIKVICFCVPKQQICFFLHFAFLEKQQKRKNHSLFPTFYVIAIISNLFLCGFYMCRVMCTPILRFSMWQKLFFVVVVAVFHQQTWFFNIVGFHFVYSFIRKMYNLLQIICVSYFFIFLNEWNNLFQSFFHPSKQEQMKSSSFFSKKCFFWFLVKGKWNFVEKNV